LLSREINGHYVLENDSIYYTKDMDATVRWFEKVLEWPGVIEARDESGNGVYGLIQPHEKSNTLGNRSPYVQLLRGEPLKSVTGFVKVWGLDNLRQRAIDNGWTELTPIIEQPWGARLFVMTTGDGSLLQFYEPLALGR
jgi:AraC family transcriptional regulator